MVKKGKNKVLIARKRPLSRSLRSGDLPRKITPFSPSDELGTPIMGEKNKVLIALSGGIDSAVSAHLLLQQGYEVEAAFMKNWSSTRGLKYDECPWLEDRQDALRVAAFLRIPLHTLDFEKQYKKNVLGYFFKEYAAGRTPNPDVMCNKEIKFKLLYDWAQKQGFKYLATGHYARVRQVVGRKVAGRSSGHELQATSFKLERSADEFKDQTYFIYNIRTEQLPHILFPVGHLKKPAVRGIAKKIGLPNAHKKESMGLCFVGRVRLKEFLEQKLKPKKGNIVDQDGNTIGRHEGLHTYTIGQRQGIRVGSGGPYFVFKKDLKKNALYVTSNPEDPRLLVKEVQIHSFNRVSPNLKFIVKTFKEIINLKLMGRYRHQGKLVPLSITQLKKDLYTVVFKKPQKAIASGQSLVLYKGKECVGGGVIV